MWRRCVLHCSRAGPGATTRRARATAHGQSAASWQQVARSAWRNIRCFITVAGAAYRRPESADWIFIAARRARPTAPGVRPFPAAKSGDAFCARRFLRSRPEIWARHRAPNYWLPRIPALPWPSPRAFHARTSSRLLPRAAARDWASLLRLNFALRQRRFVRKTLVDPPTEKASSDSVILTSYFGSAIRMFPCLVVSFSRRYFWVADGSLIGFDAHLRKSPFRSRWGASSH